MRQSRSKRDEKSVAAVEAHSNRYYYDNDTVFFENLLGGFVDGENFVPVRFGLKHSANGKATLYVMVDQNSISTKELSKAKNDTGHKDYGSDLTESIDLRRRAEYNISQIIPFVNSKDVLRYLPDDMLTEPQKRAKWEAIAETIKYTNDKNDKKYYEFIRSENLVAAKQMVERAAKTYGFTERMYHDPKKSTDVITYDDNGNIIPLSERFRTDRVGDEAWKNNDVRYSRSKRDEKSAAAAEAEAKAGEIRAQREALQKAAREERTEALAAMRERYSPRRPLRTPAFPANTLI